MRKGIVLALIVSLLLSICFVSCDKDEPVNSQNPVLYENTIPYQIINFDRNGLNCDGWSGNAIIDSREKLENFAENRTCYEFSWTKKNGTIITERYYSSWFTNIDEYNADYFSSKAIIAHLFCASSGSFRYEIEALQKIDNNIILTVRNTTDKGKNYTCDIAYWQLFIEIDKELVKDNPELIVQQIWD